MVIAPRLPISRLAPFVSPRATREGGVSKSPFPDSRIGADALRKASGHARRHRAEAILTCISNWHGGLENPPSHGVVLKQRLEDQAIVVRNSSVITSPGGGLKRPPCFPHTHQLPASCLDSSSRFSILATCSSALHSSHEVKSLKVPPSASGDGPPLLRNGPETPAIQPSSAAQ